MHPKPILHFCFTELMPKQHFAKDAALDDAIRTRFGATLEAAARCELFAWRATPEGRLAEVLFSHPGQEDNLRFEHAHKAIIDRLGRYPHSNAMLGRSSTAEELAFLSGPGSSF